ncbi:hypothetical protein [Halalkalibacterium ligniniphilum]|uniref:hypothetical protein n=1 Tax=Halalkalibacterium ligniniphilum TaxID=1134413 RepID=UPI00034A7A99|nr:hypothetical protein [Halalkalibacterium ligniniphilum]
MFYQRVQTVGSISDFMSDPQRAVKKLNKKIDSRHLKASVTTLATGVTAIAITNKMFTNVYAAGSEAIPVMATPGEFVKGAAKEKIIEAFMPLVDMIQALSYPIALVMLTGGALMFMINQKDKGIGLIQNASIGYILVQLMPLMMQLLVGIGNTVS